MRLLILVTLTLGLAGPASADSVPPLTGPVTDPAGLLPSEVVVEATAAARDFRKATGKWLVMVALPENGDRDLSALRETTMAPWEPSGAQTRIGIIYVTTLDDVSGTLLVVDPDWRRVAHEAWIPMFPQRLAEKYRDEPFDRRVALSARYFADVFPDKIAFLMQPPDVIGQDSVEFAEDVITVIKWFIYFIILFTFARTFWPARLKEDDTDEFSNELRRLRKQDRIW